MIVVASTTSYFVIVRPNVRIIPIVLGIYGYTYGSVLGIFLAGMLTKSRGNDRGNFIAMIAGFIVVTILSGLPNNLAKIFGSQALFPTGMVAGHGISVVDLLRHHRHLFRGDFVPHHPRTSPGRSLV